MPRFWDTRTEDPLVFLMAKQIKSGDALDIGAGQGRDAIFLAQQGFNVIATEYDAESLALLTLRTKKQARLSCIEADILTYEPDRQFDVIACDMVLHFLSPVGVGRAISNLQQWTMPGGYNAIMAYTDKNEPGKRPYLFSANELADRYSGWEMKSYKEEPTPWFQLAGESRPRRNHAVYMLARKKLVHV